MIASNDLSWMLKKAARSELFGFHPKFQKIEVTYLTFADDILVSSDGPSASNAGPVDVFEEFAVILGLNINSTKASLFSAGRDKHETIQASPLLGLAHSELPIWYLGHLLTTKSMTSHDLEPLIDRIRGLMLTWSNKSLSFAGRVQLINLVIMSISNFWSSSPHCQSKAKVSWEEICFPKDERLLGIRRP